MDYNNQVPLSTSSRRIYVTKGRGQTRITPLAQTLTTASVLTPSASTRKISFELISEIFSYLDQAQLWTILTDACERSDLTIFQLAYIANPSICGHFPKSFTEAFSIPNKEVDALWLAIGLGNVDIVAFVANQRRMNDKKPFLYSMHVLASKRRDQYSEEVSKHLSNALHYTKRDNQKKSLSSFSVLNEAIVSHHLTLAKNLISGEKYMPYDYGNNRQYDESTVKNMALIQALEVNHSEISSLLLKDGAHISDNTVLGYLDQKAGSDIYCNIEGIDVNKKNQSGNTALMLSTIFNFQKMVDFCLKREEIDLNCKNDHGLTALMLAVIYYNNGIVLKKLLDTKKELDLNIRDNEGQTALMWCTKLNRLEALKELTAANANSNSPSSPAFRHRIAIKDASMQQKFVPLTPIGFSYSRKNDKSSKKRGKRQHSKGTILHAK